MKATLTLYPVTSLCVSIQITPSERVLFSQLLRRVQGGSKTELSSVFKAKNQEPPNQNPIQPQPWLCSGEILQKTKCVQIMPQVRKEIRYTIVTADGTKNMRDLLHLRIRNHLHVHFLGYSTIVSHAVLLTPAAEENCWSIHSQYLSASITKNTKMNAWHSFPFHSTFICINILVKHLQTLLNPR